MSYVIIGVHGRAPKPPKDILEKWWKASIIEGLMRNERRTVEGDINFEAAYFADIFEAPMKNEDNPEPYTPASGTGPLKTYEEGWFDEIVVNVMATGGWSVDAVNHYFGVEMLAMKILEKTMKDLHEYYTVEKTREDVRDRVRVVLNKYLGKRRIMVIGHSMGSIVAYDVLREMGRDITKGGVQHFLTLGSPLGIPQVKYMIQKEHDLVRTPSLVERWTNLADRRDYVALDSRLADDFAANVDSSKVKDDMVLNGYVAPEKMLDDNDKPQAGKDNPRAGKANHHKVYGYLRTPEVSWLVRQFI